MNKRKDTALVTGASSGIGLELTRLLAKDGYDLILAARDEQRLNALAAELKETHGIRVYVMPVDLAVHGAAADLISRIKAEDLHVDILINNAGFNLWGMVADVAEEGLLRMIQVNIAALTELTRLLLPDMLAKRSGKILNLGSTGSFSPGPMSAVYCATKAYVLSFSEALAEEVRGSGVTVTVLCPGPTDTEFALRSDMLKTRAFRSRTMEASQVARIGYRAMMKGKPTVIAGLMNNLMIFGMRFAPRAAVVRTARRIMS